MIPKVTQDGPNIIPRYWCSVCGKSLPKDSAANRETSAWQFCPICGSPIEWEKAGPPLLTEHTIQIDLEDGRSITMRRLDSEAAIRAVYSAGDRIPADPAYGQGGVIAQVRFISRREVPLT